MKIFAIIFSFYMLLLPLMPCADKEECNEMESYECKSSNDNDQHEDEKDDCTPFCCCVCCPVSVFTESVNSGIVFPDMSKPAKVKYRSSLYSFNFDSIWQPPKLV